MPTLEITTKIGCDNYCFYCPQNKLINAYAGRGNELMSPESFKKFIDKVPKRIDVDFSGMCEPWLNPGCTDMVLYAFKKGHNIKVYTTLLGMTEKDLDRLECVKFDAFVVHVPSESGKETIKFTDRSMAVLKRLLRSGIQAVYLYHGTRPDKRLESLIYNKKSIQAGLITRAGNVAVDNKKILTKKEGRLYCRRGLKYNVLLPNGDVLLCCMDYGMKHILGNLEKDTYESLFKSREFKQVQKGLRNANSDILCRFCDMYAEVKHSFWKRAGSWPK